MRSFQSAALSICLAFASPQIMAKGSSIERANRKLAEMTHELKLSDAQRDKLRPVLADIEKRKEAERSAIRAFESDQLRQILTPAQTQAWAVAEKKRSPRGHTEKKPDPK